MLVSFMTLGKNLCFCRGMFVCTWVKCFSFLSRFRYLDQVSF